MKTKKFNKILLYFLALIISTFGAWFILDSLLFAIAFAILMLMFIVSIEKLNNKKNNLLHNIDAAYNFVNLMNIQMLSTSSIYEAYKSIENYIDVDFANMDNEDLKVQLEEIANNYNLNSFKMYVHTLQIYENEGGNYKKMQEIPTSLCQKCKVYYHKMIKEKKLKLIEITSLFLLWIMILVILRLAIPDYYAKMMEDIILQIVMFAVIGMGSFAYYSAVKSYLTNKIRGL